MKIEKLKQKYIEQLVDLQLKNNYKDLSKEEKLKIKCNNINFFKEIINKNDKQVIIAIDDDKILGAGIIHFVDIDKSSSISILIDNMQESIIDSLVNKMQEISKEENVNEIFFISKDDEKINNVFSKNGFKCTNKTFRCKLAKNTQIDKNINIRVRNIVNEIGKKKYKDDFCIKDEFDSLMFIRLVVTIEREFGVEIDLAKMNIHNFDTIEKICKFVEVNKDGN